MIAYLVCFHVRLIVKLLHAVEARQLLHARVHKQQVLHKCRLQREALAVLRTPEVLQLGVYTKHVLLHVVIAREALVAELARELHLRLRVHDADVILQRLQPLVICVNL